LNILIKKKIFSINKMAVKKRKSGVAKKRPVKRRQQRGDGLWDDIKNFATKANNWLKESKVISTGLKGIAPALGDWGVPVQTTGELFHQLGYGTRGRKRGGSAVFPRNYASYARIAV
jgi:hypothetical protein